MSDIAPPQDGEYAQLFCFSIDMVGSELVLANTSPGNLRSENAKYHSLVQSAVKKAGGVLSAWHGDGNVAFLASNGDEESLIIGGEAIARSILDDLSQLLPDKRFRIGVGTAPIRYWDDVQTLNSPAIVLAARLQNHARYLVKGSVLLIPGDVFSALGSADKVRYLSIKKPLGPVKLYAYVPRGAGEPLAEAPPAPREKAHPPRSGILAAMQARTADEWPGDGSPYLEIYAHPPGGSTEKPFDLEKHRDWAMQHVLELPLGTPLFREESIRNNTLEVYLAENQQAHRLQFVKFYPTGRFVFADCGWSSLPDWQGVFYPQVLNSILPKVVSFGHRYFTECLGYSKEIFVHVEIGNVAGCERKTQRLGAIPPRKFVYDGAVAVGEYFDLSTVSQVELVMKLYNEVMRQSELDPRLWGYGTESI